VAFNASQANAACLGCGFNSLAPTVQVAMEGQALVALAVGGNDSAAVGYDAAVACDNLSSRVQQ
jgi:hypothetical protein